MYSKLHSNIEELYKFSIPKFGVIMFSDSCKNRKLPDTNSVGDGCYSNLVRRVPHHVRINLNICMIQIHIILLSPRPITYYSVKQVISREYYSADWVLMRKVVLRR
jgi:hypothetical protein